MGSCSAFSTLVTGFEEPGRNTLDAMAKSSGIPDSAGEFMDVIPSPVADGGASDEQYSRLGRDLSTYPIHWGGVTWHGNFTTIDLIAASTNAVNGALLARRPDHFKQFTVIGIMLMAILGGIGGGVTRDVLVNEVPRAIAELAYLFLCIIFGVIGYNLAYAKGQLFREGLFQFMTVFSSSLVCHRRSAKRAGGRVAGRGLPLMADVGPTAGRYFIDVTSRVTPKQFIRGEYVVTTAILTGVVWMLCIVADAGAWVAAIVAFAFV